VKLKAAALLVIPVRVLNIVKTLHASTPIPGVALILTVLELMLLHGNVLRELLLLLILLTYVQLATSALKAPLWQNLVQLELTFLIQVKVLNQNVLVVMPVPLVNIEV
jgi:hypothetical protein